MRSRSMTAIPSGLSMRKRNKPFLTLKEIALLGMMTALLETVKFALQSIPNVELVTLLVMIFTLMIGPKVVIAIFAFVGLECFVWGLGVWTVMYLYVWPILMLCTFFLRSIRSKWPFVMLSAMFGFFFGALCSLPYFFIGGATMAFSWWIAGIPYDLIHGGANAVVCVLLFDPLRRLAEKLSNRYLYGIIKT